MKVFSCWWGGGYTRSLGEHSIEWFKTNRGYEDEDIRDISALEIGSSIILSNGDHIVTRVE